MRFFATITLLTITATATAQSATSHTATTTASLSPQQTCLAACGYADICCQAACVNVPCPNQAQANATTECAGQCPQGNGSAADTQRYAACQSGCISSYFLSATANLAQATSASSSSSYLFGQTGSVSSSATGSTSHSGSGSATSSGNGAVETRAAIAGAGLFGLLAIGLAL